MRKLAIASLALLGCYKEPNVTIICDGSPCDVVRILRPNRMLPM